MNPFDVHIIPDTIKRKFEQYKNNTKPDEISWFWKQPEAGENCRSLYHLCDIKVNGNMGLASKIMLLLKTLDFFFFKIGSSNPSYASK